MCINNGRLGRAVLPLGRDFIESNHWIPGAARHVHRTSRAVGARSGRMRAQALHVHARRAERRRGGRVGLRFRGHREQYRGHGQRDHRHACVLVEPAYPARSRHPDLDGIAHGSRTCQTRRTKPRTPPPTRFVSSQKRKIRRSRRSATSWRARSMGSGRWRRAFRTPKRTRLASSRSLGKVSRRSPGTTRPRS